MSEGERVERWVYERMPDGEVPGVWTYLGAEFICDASNSQSHVFYRRIPDPVPALQARISDYVDTVEAMLAAAGLDLSNHAEAEAEVSRCGSRPSDYIRAKFAEAQARIAELEGIFRNLSLLVSDGKGFEVEAHPDGATILLTEHDGATTYEMETQRSVFDALVWAADFAASREPTPAAAKET